MPKNSKRSNKNKIMNQDKAIVFKSSKYLMSFVADEYTKEFARSDKLDSKGIALTTLLVGFLTLAFPVINFNFIINSFYVENSHIVRLGTMSAVLFIVSFVLIIYTLVTILKIFKIREYRRFNVENAKNIEIECCSENVTADSLINVYVNDIEYNQKINNDKAVLIEKSYILVIISVILILLTSIFTIIGGTIWKMN